MTQQWRTKTLETDSRPEVFLAPTKAPRQDDKNRPILSQENRDGTAADTNRTHMKKGAKRGKKKQVVFLIEDEQDTADLIRLHLEQSGMSVVHVKDGRQAIDMMETIAPPCVVLLDLVVPYFNGFELLKIIRTKAGWEQVQVMVVSGDSYPGDINRMILGGAEDYVVKSRGVGEILHRLKRMLEKVA